MQICISYGCHEPGSCHCIWEDQFAIAFSKHQATIWLMCNPIYHLSTFPMHYTVHRRRRWYPTPVLLPGESHGRRSLVGCNPWGRKESDTTEPLPFHFRALEKEMATHSSALAWRIPGMGEPGGVTQSRTRLK